jgi:hypothetical protein
VGGTWRHTDSRVAHPAGGGKVAGSSPVAPIFRGNQLVLSIESPDAGPSRLGRGFLTDLGGNGAALGIGQCGAELAPGADLQLVEHLPEVPLDRARAEEELRADLRVRVPVGRQAGDLRFLRSQFISRLDRARRRRPPERLQSRGTEIKRRPEPAGFSYRSGRKRAVRGSRTPRRAKGVVPGSCSGTFLPMGDEFTREGRSLPP